MPKSKSDQDLFKNSTMTFGEHLEELRICLWKSLVGLMLGFVLGLFVSPQVVDGIQSPLRKALNRFYTDKSLKTVEANLTEFESLGYPKEILKRIEDERILPELVLINPSELGKKLGLTSADSAGGTSGESPGRPPSDAADEATSDAADKATSDAADKATSDAADKATSDAADKATSDSPDKTAKDYLAPVYLWRKIADDKRVRTSSFNAHESFTIFIKAGLLVGVLLSSPWLFYQVWTFVAVGLYRHERKYVHIFLPFSLGLFFAGAALAFFFVFGPVLKFLFVFNEMLNIDPDPRISEWLGFVIMLPLGFGIAFQLPLVMLFLERIGLFTVEVYLKKWRIAILVIFVISMFLTPADPQSMLLMAVPLTVLYFGGVLVCHLFPRSKSPYEEPFEEEDYV